MKKNIQKLIALIFVITCLFSLSACVANDEQANSSTASTSSNTASGDKIEKTGLWQNAKYLSDTTLGEGKTTFKLEVKVENKSVFLTINTDKDTVGAALLENKVIEGEESQYGLYIKKVNGITADYDIDKSYWAFYVDGEYASSGADTTKIEKDKTYKLEYAK